MTTYMVMAPDGIRVGVTGLCRSRGTTVTDGMIGNPALVRAMVEEGVIEAISDLHGWAMDGLCRIPGVYPQLALDMIEQGIPSEAEIEEANRRGLDAQHVALEAVMNAPAEQLVKVRGIGQVKAEKLQAAARAVLLRAAS